MTHEEVAKRLGYYEGTVDTIKRWLKDKDYLARDELALLNSLLNLPEELTCTAQTKTAAAVGVGGQTSLQQLRE
jgi:hypothetical protein